MLHYIQTSKTSYRSAWHVTAWLRCQLHTLVSPLPPCVHTTMLPRRSVENTRPRHAHLSISPDGTLTTSTRSTTGGPKQPAKPEEAMPPSLEPIATGSTDLVRPQTNVGVSLPHRLPDSGRLPVYGRSASDRPKERSLWNHNHRSNYSLEDIHKPQPLCPNQFLDLTLPVGLTDRVSPASVKGGAGCAGRAKRGPPCRRRDTQARLVYTLVRLLAYQRLNLRPSSHAKENTVGLLRKRLALPTWTHLRTQPLRRSDCGCGHLLRRSDTTGPCELSAPPNIRSHDCKRSRPSYRTAS